MKAIKILLAMVIAASLGFAAGFVAVSNRLLENHRADLARQRAQWRTEKETLETALQRAQKQAASAARVSAPGHVMTVTNQVSPAETLALLRGLKVSASQPRSVRQAIHQFETLIESGPAALPAIRAFLARNEEIDYDASAVKNLRDGRMAPEFTLPPSLRLGLFEVVKQIGGEASEKLLAEILSTTGRGIEVAYLARVLQELAPNQYRALALSAARELLAHPEVTGSANGLDKLDREALYGVLSFFNDGTYVAQAQSQLVQPSGQIDRVALRYVQQTLGEQSLMVAAQLWQDTRIPAEQKEPLARLALAYVGANPQADRMYQTAIADPNLPKEDRRNLIEDLNQDGFPNTKRLTASDLPLIQKRLEFIQQNAPNAVDSVAAAAFAEAQKDLVNMWNRVQTQAAPTPTKPAP